MPGSDYLDSILRSQAQSKITGRGALTGPQLEAAFKGELAARYESDVARSREAFQEAATTRSLDIQQESLDAQKRIAPIQTAVSAIGAGGMAAIGAGVLKKAFTSTGDKPVAPGTEAATTAGVGESATPEVMMQPTGYTEEGVPIYDTSMSTTAETLGYSGSMGAMDAAAAGSSAAGATSKSAGSVIQMGGEMMMSEGPEAAAVAAAV